MQCSYPIWIDKNKILAPCMRCMSCRIKRSAEWSMRLQHEFKEFEYKGMFLTLTYSDEHIHPRHSLVKKDLQDFFKRLRRRLKKRKIKYFACGEYGENTDRPHYHAIIIGLSNLSKYDRKMVGKSWPWCDWTPQRIRKSMGSVTPDSILYTTSYIQKKFINSDKEVVEIYFDGNEGEFQLQSKGIGEKHIIKNKADVEKTGKVKYKGKEVGLPRYYHSKVEVPREIKDINKKEMYKTLKEKYPLKDFDVPSERYTGKVLDTKYKDELSQRERNILSKIRLDNKEEIF